jgi:hypothetical protein
MSVIEVNRAIILNPFLVKLSEVQVLYERISVGRMEAAHHEARAKQLVIGDFSSKASHEFMLRVIDWGKGHRFLERAAENDGQDVSKCVREAHRLGSQGNLAKAVTEIQKLRYVGHSFASKHIRMMFPESAATLDSRIRRRLGYGENEVGYTSFLKDLANIKSMFLNSEEVPSGTKENLRICDIEMIIYAALGKK